MARLRNPYSLDDAMGGTQAPSWDAPDQPIDGRPTVRFTGTSSPNPPRGWTYPDGIATTPLTGAPQPFSWGDWYGGRQFTDPMQGALEQFIKERTQSFNANPSGGGFGFAGANVPSFSQGDWDALRAKAMNEIETTRTAGVQRANESLAARGISPSSGVATDNLQQVNRAFDQMRAQSVNNMVTAEIANRQNQAQNALQAAQINMQGAIAGANQQRAQQGDVLAMLSMLPTMAQNNIGSLLAGINGQTPNPSNLFQNAYQMANANQQMNVYNQLLQGQMMQGWAELLMRALGGQTNEA